MAKRHICKWEHKTNYGRENLHNGCLMNIYELLLYPVFRGRVGTFLRGLSSYMKAGVISEFGQREFPSPYKLTD
jgi:hypothetical protein